jgi:hypothetical protein
MPDYTSDPTPDDISEASAFLATQMNDSATWRSVAYTPDGRGGVTRVFTDTVIPCWVRNPMSAPGDPIHAPGTSLYEWEFICPLSYSIQAKDVLVYAGLSLEVVEVIQHGTASFSQVVYGKRVS